MEMRHVVLIVCTWLLVAVAQGARVDTIRVYSPSMKKQVPVVVVEPNKKKPHMPVVYLLHGYSDSYKSGWINKVEGITTYADRYSCLLVMPDGGFSSWYFDSPEDKTYRYETFVAGELVSYIDSHYSTLATAKGRAIAGNSMGGHGAWFLALRHPNVFGAAGSMSGGVNLCPFSKQFDIALRLGSYEKHPQRWADYSVVNVVEHASKPYPALIMSCGTDDFFYQENIKLHEKLLRLGIAHYFISSPGNHSWQYWTQALQYQMVFFNEFFHNK